MPLAPPSDAPGAIDGQYRRLSLLLHQTIFIDYLGGTDPIFICWAEPRPGLVLTDPVWRIAKLTFDGNHNVTNVQWANGTIAYAFKASDRANVAIITYS